MLLVTTTLTKRASCVGLSALMGDYQLLNLLLHNYSLCFVVIIEMFWDFHGTTQCITKERLIIMNTFRLVSTVVKYSLQFRGVAGSNPASAYTFYPKKALEPVNNQHCSTGLQILTLSKE